MKCPSCSQEIRDVGVVCPFCATPLDDAVTSGPTELGGEPAAHAPTPTPFSDSGQHGRFLPGTTVAGRYRIVGLLGRGGMGEVYRADDLKLGQQVALKFLPRKFMDDEAHVERLLDEVRMARQVSHPNVCRVWDIGEAEGLHYVSMEYVDGEDLASLLRRIGRLPKDKAVEISRQLCAALAAAHDEGVLHRDLKPANVMLDGHGRVKLTDFGLSAVAEVRAGTPVYMAPEQLAGETVSVQSDLFALGLVLHEVFTGKRVFEAGALDDLRSAHERSMSESLTTASDFDPAIDRLINRCLAPDPAQRPKSALAVAAGLPGADPLAAALAAGETPSPEMVAEAGGEGKMPAMYAVPLLLVAVVGALAYGAFMQRVSDVAHVPFDEAPAVLDARARGILADLGFDEEPADTAYGYEGTFNDFRDWLRASSDDPARWEVLREGRPAVATFWWRSSPRPLVARGISPIGLAPTVSFSNPPIDDTRGMVGVRLDMQGNLLTLRAVPHFFADPRETFGETDWSQMFAAAGLDIDDFSASEPRTTPNVFADTRLAWEGVWPTLPEASLRIEASSFRGRPVSWTMHSPWTPAPTAPRDFEAARSAGFGRNLLIPLIGMFILAGIWVARRNIRLGRGDRRGADRLALAVVIVWMLGWAFAGAELPSFFPAWAWVLPQAGWRGRSTWWSSR